MLFLKFLFAFIVGTQFTLYAQTIDFNQIVKENETHKRPMMVFFHTDHCPYCKKMITEEFDNPNIKKFIDKEFYFIDINVDSKTKIIYKDFKGTADQFGDLLEVRFYPTIMFMDNNVIVSNIKGYRNPTKFNVIMKYIATKSFESMDLETFINELEMKD
ncbi:MAG: thioredoxin family protein [Arcobacteraceae bacterium]|jgi:thioredoxin-related protein